MTRMVLDVNFAREPALAEWLAGSRSRRVVLTDGFAVESYNTGQLSGLLANFEVLSDYPDQVDILFPSGRLVGLVPRAAGSLRRMLDTKMTAGFAEFTQKLKRAPHSAAVRKAIEPLILQASANTERLVEPLRRGGFVDCHVEGVLARRPQDDPPRAALLVRRC